MQDDVGYDGVFMDFVKLYEKRISVLEFRNSTQARALSLSLSLSPHQEQKRKKEKRKKIMK